MSEDLTMSTARLIAAAIALTLACAAGVDAQSKVAVDVVSIDRLDDATIAAEILFRETGRDLIVIPSTASSGDFTQAIMRYRTIVSNARSAEERVGRVKIRRDDLSSSRGPEMVKVGLLLQHLNRMVPKAVPGVGKGRSQVIWIDIPTKHP